MEKKQIDYIIVGQGLAGSVLVYTLIKEKKSVIVIDENNPNTSSKIAAGLCNPIVFKRLTKSWMVEETLPIAVGFYKEQEVLLENDFYTDLPIYKLFAQEQEKKNWQQKCNEPELFDWLSPETNFPFDKTYFYNEFGASKTLQSGFLKTEKWLSHFQTYLKEKNLFLEEKFDYKLLKINNETVAYKNISATNIIFCEGYKTTQNPYFNWLPFKLTKGEVLTINFKNITLNAAINKGVFILPYNNNYKLGATYDWDNLDENTTEKAKNELLEKAKKIIADEIIVVNHKAGIRPTVSDRKPIIGQHPEFKNVYIFNGLGTKGVMLAPYFAQQLAQFLLKNKLLPEEVNINRFYKL